MSEHLRFKFSVTIHSDDLAVVHCLRSLADFSQKGPRKMIAWGNTKEPDWTRDGHTVTFHFTSSRYRESFLHEVERLLPSDLWTKVRRSDADPARPAK